MIEKEDVCSNSALFNKDNFNDDSSTDFESDDEDEQFQKTIIKNFMARGGYS